MKKKLEEMQEQADVKNQEKVLDVDFENIDDLPVISLSILKNQLERVQAGLYRIIIKKDKIIKLYQDSMKKIIEELNDGLKKEEELKKQINSEPIS